MNAIRTNAAAALLGVSPSTLRSWERRYGFPRPQRSPGGHRQYSFVEIEALRRTLDETHNISSAISIARERGAGPSTTSLLVSAYAGFDDARANAVLEESLAVRTVERTIEELLVTAVEEHHCAERTTPEFEFAWRHATGWLSAQSRLAPPASRPDGVLLLDGSRTRGLEALHTQALEVVLRRAGVRLLTLSTDVEPTRLGRAVRALTPRAVVLAGSGASLDAIGRLVYVVRGLVEGSIVFDYRGAVPDTGASTVTRLGTTPLAARDLLLGTLTGNVAAAGSANAARAAQTA